jgi:hypothetical protein
VFLFSTAMKRPKGIGLWRASKLLFKEKALREL